MEVEEGQGSRMLGVGWGWRICLISGRAGLQSMEAEV